MNRPADSFITIRGVRDEDSGQILAVLKAVFEEYEGCLLDLSEVPDLIKPATSVRERGGQFWVAERRSEIVGFVALAPTEDAQLVELKKLYTRADARGIGLGRRLIELVEEEARLRKAQRIDLWTDTRFITAHRVYERCGYVRMPETRELHDVSRSVEYHYEKRLA